MTSHPLTLSAIPQLLIALLTIKYRTENPFETHPTTMFFAISSIVVCYFMDTIVLRFPMSRYAEVTRHILVWILHVTVSTLSAALYPERAAPFIYAAFALLSLGDMLCVFRHRHAVEDSEGEGEVEAEAEVEEFTLLKKKFYDVAKFFGYQPQPTLPL